MAVKIQKGNVAGLVNLTPMIDMVFLLLIFFIVTSRFEEEQQRTLEGMQLPQASEAMPLMAKPRELFINIDAQGRYFVGGEFLELAALEELLRQAAVNNPGRQTAIIRADKRAAWQYVVTAMNLCVKAGIRDIRPTTADLGN